MQNVPLTPAAKALRTATWARTMTKWLITRSSKGGVRWQLVDFNGAGGQESRGIVDLLAIRKNHRPTDAQVKRGDLFEMILVQVKGGSAKRPSALEVARLLKVMEHHRADKAVLVEWKKGAVLRCFNLAGGEFMETSASAIFGEVPRPGQIAAAGIVVLQEVSTADASL